MGDDLSETITAARRHLGLSQVVLARRAGISASYLSRIEGAAWTRGGPWPSDTVLRALARALNLSSSHLIALRDAARARHGGAPARSAPYAVSIGDAAVHRAAQRVIEDNPRGGTLRITDVVRLEHPRRPMHDCHFAHWDALARRLADDADSLLYRVCSSTPDHFDLVRKKTAHLAGGREPPAVGNIRTRFCFGNPLVLDVVVGEQEVFVGIPDRRGHPHLRAGIVVDDPDFVAAVRAWFDEFVWEATCDCLDVRYPTVQDSLDAIGRRLGTSAGSPTRT